MSQSTIANNSTNLSRRPAAPVDAHRRTQRTVLVFIMAAALALTATLQGIARGMRDDLLGASAGNARVSNLDSFALSLVLGGLRGPLVMALWSSSESQKSEKNLEDFNTKVELIRLLQPEFDTVHIFQIWNKAYNISAQSANLSNKYAEILDALRYGDNVNKQRPNDVNILVSQGMIFNDKFGNSAQGKEYYRPKVRNDTKALAPGQVLRPLSTNARPTRLEPLLDADGNLLPFAAARYPQLVQYQPFPYGLSAHALGYGLFATSQGLVNNEHQRHLQLNDNVVDNLPNTALKKWSEEEMDLGRYNELEAFGLPVAIDADRNGVETQADNVPFTSPVRNADKLREAIYNYDRGSRLAADAEREMVEHEQRYSQYTSLRSTHDNLIAARYLLTADADYLKAGLEHDPAQRTALLKDARDNYRSAEHAYRTLLLQWWITPEEASQAHWVDPLTGKQYTHYDRATVGQYNIAQLDAITIGVSNLYKMILSIKPPPYNPFTDEWTQFGANITRASERAALIEKTLQ